MEGARPVEPTVMTTTNVQGECVVDTFLPVCRASSLVLFMTATLSQAEVCCAGLQLPEKVSSHMRGFVSSPYFVVSMLGFCTNDDVKFVYSIIIKVSGGYWMYNN